jgi:peptide/nickel transport system substrate-binding protein
MDPSEEIAMTQRRSVSGFILLASLLALALLAPSAASAAYKKTMVAVHYIDPQLMDPHVARAYSTLILPIQIYDKLVDYKGATTEIEPRLATSWKLEADGKTWTFALRRGVKFHDGREFKADAVKFSFERLLALGKEPAGLYRALDRVEVVDDYTVRMHLKHPVGPWLAILANIKGGYIVNPNVMQHEVKKDGKGDWAEAWVTENTNGTGPYKLIKWEKGQQLVLQRNPDYWDKTWDTARAIDRVIVQIIREDVGRRLALTTGKADLLVRSMSPEEFDQVKKDPKVEAVALRSNNINHIPFNVTEGPTANKKFREAVAHAYDYDGLIKHVLLGYASRARGPIPAGMPGFNPDTPLVTRDVAKAKRLLQESGVDVSKVELELNFTTGVRWTQQTMELLQSNLAEIGVKSRLAPSTFLTMIGKWQKPATRGAMYTQYFSPEMADPYALLDAIYASGSQWNLIGFSQPEVDRLLKVGRESTDQGQRMDAYKKAQVLVVHEVPAIYTHEMMGLFAYSKKLKGVTFNPTRFEGWYFRDMYLEE